MYAKTIRKDCYQQKKPKESKKKFEPLVAAVIIMFAAVCVIVGVFIWLLRENAELQRLKQSVTETVQTAESKQLQETLEKIQTQATEISDNLNDYSWIGSEEDGKISYLKQLDDGSWQVRKILIYPSLSRIISMKNTITGRMNCFCIYLVRQQYIRRYKRRTAENRPLLL